MAISHSRNCNKCHRYNSCYCYCYCAAGIAHEINNNLAFDDLTLLERLEWQIGISKYYTTSRHVRFLLILYSLPFITVVVMLN